MAARQERYGRYEALFPIAVGGMAEVFAARLHGEGGFEKLVALKVMHRHLAADPAFVKMFLDEARLAANVSSPNVVATLDLGKAEDDTLFLIMDLVVGVPLSALLASRQGEGLPLGIAVEIAAQAALGLHDAHEATTPDGQPLGIVHRDVSPQNILVGADGRVRIADFGVAHAVQRLTSTAGGHVKGKYAYFSPEQAVSGPLDRRSDVFALGIVLWEAITGESLFRGETPLETLKLLLERSIPKASASHPHVSPALDEVLSQALDRNKEKRTPTTAKLAAELRRAMHPHPLPSATELGRFVADAGGEQLERLRTRIRNALKGREAEGAEPAPAADGTRRVRRAGGHPMSAEASGGVDVDFTPDGQLRALHEPGRAGTRYESAPLGVRSTAAATEPVTDFGSEAAQLSVARRRRRWLFPAAAAVALGSAGAVLLYSGQRWLSPPPPPNTQADSVESTTTPANAPPSVAATEPGATTQPDEPLSPPSSAAAAAASSSARKPEEKATEAPAESAAAKALPPAAAPVIAPARSAPARPATPILPPSVFDQTVKK